MANVVPHTLKMNCALTLLGDSGVLQEDKGSVNTSLFGLIGIAGGSRPRGCPYSDKHY